jgi:poly(A) polymerase
LSEPIRLDARKQGLFQEDVDPNALDVTDRLTQAGFQALLVGGCVRDLLLGATPKDFDVATNATPEEVRALFRRSRMVGRRFRIVHVRYGRNLIEVSTFRRSHAAEQDERHHSEEGMILRDNVYGTLEEDAFRRDFTINALYYDPANEEILDFVGGLDDLDNADLKFIGDAEVRLREDPVRVLRAVRFQSKLNFKRDTAIDAHLEATARGLGAIPPARLFDELSKLLMSGFAATAWSLIEPSPLRKALFPNSQPNDEITRLAMINTDNRIAQDKPVTPGFLLAVLMWSDYLARVDELGADMKPLEAQTVAASETLAEQQQVTSVPRRFSQFVRDVWALQGRLEARQARHIDRVAQHPRFRAAYDFILLRAEVAESGQPDQSGEPTESLQDIADWWTNFQEAGDDERREMVDARRAHQPKKRRRRRSSPKSRNTPTE